MVLRRVYAVHRGFIKGAIPMTAALSAYQATTGFGGWERTMQEHMSYRLNSLKGGYIEDNIGDYLKDYKGRPKSPSGGSYVKQPRVTCLLESSRWCLGWISASAKRSSWHEKMLDKPPIWGL